MRQNDIREAMLSRLPSLFEWLPRPQGDVQVVTPMLYPDGGIVDVFIRYEGDHYVVTDYGDAVGWLDGQSISGHLSPNQRVLLNEIIATLGIEFHGGRLQTKCHNPDLLAEAVQLVAQAVVRVSDLSFTFRKRRVVAVGDKVEDWLKQRQFGVERGIKCNGRSGRQWRVDYRVSVHSQRSLVFLLSSATRGAARKLSEHVVAGCFDLRHLLESGEGSLVSLFDDSVDVWRTEDINLVQDVSKVVMWSRPEKLEEALTSA